MELVEKKKRFCTAVRAYAAHFPCFGASFMQMVVWGQMMFVAGDILYWVLWRAFQVQIFCSVILIRLVAGHVT